MKIEKDKWRHFFAGIAMGLALQALFQWLWRGQIAALLAFIMVVVISYGFEVYSKITGRGHYEIMDAVAAILGGVLGMGLALLFLSI